MIQSLTDLSDRLSFTRPEVVIRYQTRLIAWRLLMLVAIRAWPSSVLKTAGRRTYMREYSMNTPCMTTTVCNEVLSLVVNHTTLTPLSTTSACRFNNDTAWRWYSSSLHYLYQRTAGQSPRYNILIHIISFDYFIPCLLATFLLSLLGLR